MLGDKEGELEEEGDGYNQNELYTSMKFSRIKIYLKLKHTHKPVKKSTNKHSWVK